MAVTTSVMLMMAATAAATALQGVASIQAGKAAEQAADARATALEHQAAQARQNAGQERAAAQRDAFATRRQGQLIESKALARAAASGAGAGDPTVENILGEIGAEGEFRALTDLFVGEERAKSLEFQADIGVFEAGQSRRAGDAARSAANIAALATFAGGAGTLAGQAGFFDKPKGLARYGTPGPGFSKLRRTPGRFG